MKTIYVYPSTEIVYTDTPLQTLESKVTHQGMTLRDHFAGLALQAILSQPNIGEVLRNLECKNMKDSDEQISITAFRLADVMMEIRDRTEIEP